MKDKFNYLLILFILLLLMVPVLSIESIIPWIIFLFFSSLCIKLRRKEISLNRKLITAFGYCILAGSLGVLFNFAVTQGTKLVISMFL